MGTIVELDSFFRDRGTNPSPAAFTVPAEQLNGWSSSARSVRAYPSNPSARPLEFSTSVELKNVTIPYVEAFVSLARVYLTLRSQRYQDINLISSIEGTLRDATFTLVLDHIQTDAMGVPLFLHYRPLHNQVMRFMRNSPVEVRLFDYTGSTLPIVDTPLPGPPDRTLQTLITFEALPFVRDDDFANHSVDVRT